MKRFLTSVNKVYAYEKIVPNFLCHPAVYTRFGAEIVVVACLSLPAASLTRHAAVHRARSRTAAEPNAKADLLSARLGRTRVQMRPFTPSTIHCTTTQPYSSLSDVHTHAGGVAFDNPSGPFDRILFSQHG